MGSSRARFRPRLMELLKAQSLCGARSQMGLGPGTGPRTLVVVSVSVFSMSTLPLFSFPPYSKPRSIVTAFYCLFRSVKIRRTCKGEHAYFHKVSSRKDKCLFSNIGCKSQKWP